MCLITNEPQRIVEEDMIVFKRVDAFPCRKLRVDSSLSIDNMEFAIIVKSPIQTDFIWTPNKLEETKLKVESTKFDYCIEHYDLDSTEGFTEEEMVDVISEGFHSAKTEERLCFKTSTHIAKFLIPAGATIYEDNSGLLVSNKIIFLELLKD